VTIPLDASDDCCQLFNSTSFLPAKEFYIPPPFLFIFVYLFKKEKSPAIRRTCIKYQKTDRQVNRREISRKRFITHVGIMVL
jgi:hypothetical protein